MRRAHAFDLDKNLVYRATSYFGHLGTAMTVYPPATDENIRSLLKCPIDWEAVTGDVGASHAPLEYYWVYILGKHAVSNEEEVALAHQLVDFDDWIIGGPSDNNREQILRKIVDRRPFALDE
jgi:hypothetical protein